MFSKIFAAAALSVVSASDVPLFSSNDDYDEINLNIRMLSNGTTTHTLSAKANIEGNFPAGQTAVTLNTNNGFKLGFCNTAKGAVNQGVAAANQATMCTVSSVSDNSRRRGRQLSTNPLKLQVAYALTFASAAASDAAKAVVDDTSATSAFATYMTQHLATNVAAADNTLTITGVAAVSGGSTTGSGSTVAAAPSPSPSSNAAKLAMSTLAAFAAFMATMM